MKNKKYRLLSMGGFEMFQSWVDSIDHYDLADVYNLFVQFVKKSCDLDIAITKQRVYFYDKINGNQYYIEKKYIVNIARAERVLLRHHPSEDIFSSIYMDRITNRKWINAQNLIKRY